MKASKIQKDEGFTFIETLIVLAITVILSAGIGIPALRHIETAKRTAAKGQIETFRIALQTYYLDCGSYPNGAQGLEALYKKPVISPVPDNWNGPYLDRKIPNDPWAYQYQYRTPGPDGLPYSIESYGNDNQEGGNGNDADICSWN